MSRQEIEKLLLEAIDKLNKLDSCYRQEVGELKERISYLEELIDSQRNMLEDSVDYINRLESTQFNGKRS